MPTNNPPLVRQEIYRNILLKVVLHNYNLFINWFLGKINFCFFHVSGSCLCQSPYICAHVTPMNIPWDVDNSCALVNKFRVRWIWAPSVRGDWTARHSTLLQAAPHPPTTAWRASTVWSVRPHRAYTPGQGSGQAAGSSRRQNLYR